LQHLVFEWGVVMVMGRPRLARQMEREFWRQVHAGLVPEDAAVAAGVSRTTGRTWFRERGGVAVDVAESSGRYLSLAEREEIAVGLAARESVRAIARRLGRAPSTVSREVRRNCPRTGGYLTRTRYRAGAAQAAADARARRPKVAKLVAHPPLRGYVQDKLAGRQRWSPEQISERLRRDFPDDERMRVSPETIYQSIYVQGRGALRRELAACLRTGRAVRKAQRRADERRGRIKDMVMISERPAEAADRAVPGHWEGDLIIGRDGASAIGTLVERSTRFTMLLHLTDQRAATVRDAIAATITTLPVALRRSLTWDQGRELADHAGVRLATDMQVYFCDPASPWQRGTNENTNGLLRQYFPKGTDLSVHPPEHLTEIADALNGRPRKTLDWRTPTEALNELLSPSN
jgi:IS30 family transposase